MAFSACPLLKVSGRLHSYIRRAVFHTLGNRDPYRNSLLNNYHKGCNHIISHFRTSSSISIADPLPKKRLYTNLIVKSPQCHPELKCQPQPTLHTQRIWLGYPDIILIKVVLCTSGYGLAELIASSSYLQRFS